MFVSNCLAMLSPYERATREWVLEIDLDVVAVDVLNVALDDASCCIHGGYLREAVKVMRNVPCCCWHSLLVDIRIGSSGAGIRDGELVAQAQHRNAVAGDDVASAG